ncbi:hypothetical protein pb186bvf_004509 [Paramecium bursaria]
MINIYKLVLLIYSNFKADSRSNLQKWLLIQYQNVPYKNIHSFQRLPLKQLQYLGDHYQFQQQQRHLSYLTSQNPYYDLISQQKAQLLNDILLEVIFWNSQNQ